MPPSVAHPKNPELLGALLRDVSRSFHLTLKFLPCEVRPLIGLAYLLARTSDTIADTGAVKAEERLRSLALLRQRLLGLCEDRLDFSPYLQAQGTPAERALLGRVEEAAQLLEATPAADRTRIQTVLSVILSGQELDLRRFGTATQEAIQSLRVEAELEDYTYRVAGCVGEFWTRICLDHLPVRGAVDTTRLMGLAVRFGRGLQLVNILRDIPADLRNGRCYLPLERLKAASLEPSDLLNPAKEPALRPVLDGYLAEAEAHLEAGWHYTVSLPSDWKRVRLACAWPVLIGARTLGRLRREPLLDASRRVKISRKEVRSIVVGSLLRLPFRQAWENQFPLARRG